MCDVWCDKWYDGSHSGKSTHTDHRPVLRSDPGLGINRVDTVVLAVYGRSQKHPTKDDKNVINPQEVKNIRGIFHEGSRTFQNLPVEEHSENLPELVKLGGQERSRTFRSKNIRRTFRRNVLERSAPTTTHCVLKTKHKSIYHQLLTTLEWKQTKLV